MLSFLIGPTKLFSFVWMQASLDILLACPFQIWPAEWQEVLECICTALFPAAAAHRYLLHHTFLVLGNFFPHSFDTLLAPGGLWSSSQSGPIIYTGSWQYCLRASYLNSVVCAKLLTIRSIILMLARCHYSMLPKKRPTNFWVLYICI